MTDLTMTTKPLSVVAKLCYAFGGVGGEILWVVFGAYTSIFLVDVAQDCNINSVYDCNERVDVACPGCWDGRKAGLVHHTVHCDGARSVGSIIIIGGMVGGVAMHGQILASFRRSEHDSCDNMTYSANSSTNSSVDGVSLEMTIGHGGIALYVQYSLDLEDQIENVLLSFMIGHGGIALYVQYSLDLEDQIENVLLSFMVASVLAMPVIGWVVSKLGRKNAYICLMLTGERLDTPFVAILLSCGSLAITVGLIMATIALELIVSDITEDCYLQTGERLDTPFVAILLSCGSLAITVGLIMATIALEIGGYKLGSCTQPDTVGSALRILLSAFTSVLTFIGVVFAWRYPITEDRRKEIAEAINKRYHCSLTMAEVAKTMTTKPLSVVAKLCYAFGGVGNEIIFIVFGAYTSIFLVDVAQLPPLFATSIIFGSRVVDVLCNVFMGPLIDRTNTRWGKIKPWIVTSALVMTVTNALIWYVPDVGTGGKLAWYIILYIVMKLAWSGFVISYRTFVMFLSDDSSERDSAIQYRTIFTIGGTVVGMVMHGQILASFRRSEHDSCDNMTYSGNNSTNSSVDGVSLEMTIGHGAIALYAQYSLDLEDQIENILLAFMVASVLAMPVIGWVVSKLGRKTSYICFMLNRRLQTWILCSA
uniref:Uncharacterized protein n=1 Tax=Branchiostoma floridae TaxID=7739 RepID=C3Y2E4_BRAFL|eukprot:XP_002609489.1 hypothetical protein BRAFLDRAFT_95583 [Branchiostoma floridae]